MSDTSTTITPQTKLDAFLKASGVSQRDFARRVKSHQSIISRLLAGDLMPSLPLAARIERETKRKVPAVEWVPVNDKGAA